MAKKIYQITKYRYAAAALSAVLLLLTAVFYIAFGGFNLGIDFQSGFSQTVKISDSSAVSIDDVRAALGGDASVQMVGDESAQTFQIRLANEDGLLEEELSSQVNEALTADFSEVTILQSDFVGPKYSSTLVSGSILIVIVAIALILIYIWIRFHLSFAIAAIITLVHDTFVLIGFITIFRLEVSSTTIAALLTIIGYSLNNVIVIFDRIRENRPLLTDLPLSQIIDTSVSQSLSRTIFSSFTTALAITPLAIFASGAIQLFAIEMVFGILVGAYSSNFLAPALYMWITKNKVVAKKIAEADKAQAETGEEEKPAPVEVEIPRAERKPQGKRQQKK